MTTTDAEVLFTPKSSQRRAGGGCQVRRGDIGSGFGIRGRAFVLVSAAESESPTRDQRTKLLSCPHKGTEASSKPSPRQEPRAETAVRSPLPLVQAYDPV